MCLTWTSSSLAITYTHLQGTKQAHNEAHQYDNVEKALKGIIYERFPFARHNVRVNESARTENKTTRMEMITTSLYIALVASNPEHTP